jgi:DNA-binding IscR family transcriptional regulator
MQDQIFSALQTAYRESGRIPVSSKAVATRAYCDDSYVRRVFRDLEKRGLVQRYGQRKGWMPAGV